MISSCKMNDQPIDSTDADADDERRRRVEYDSNSVWTARAWNSIRDRCRDDERMRVFPFQRRHDVWEWFPEHG